MDTKHDIQKNIFETLKEKFGYTNIFQTPKIEKIIVSTGIGSIKDKKEPKAGRVFGPIPREIGERGYQKIMSLATEVV